MGISFSDLKKKSTNKANQSYNLQTKNENPNFQTENLKNQAYHNRSQSPPSPQICDPLLINSIPHPMPMSNDKPEPKPEPKPDPEKKKTTEINNQSGYFSKFRIHLFNKSQAILKIRSGQGVFSDQHFPPNNKVFGPPNSKFMSEFKQKSQMKWERTKVISYHKGNKSNEFVLDPSGKTLANYTSLPGKNYFSHGDIYQGSLGSCFFLAVMLGLTRNTEVITHVLPLDNAKKSNIIKGAFHFRFWKLGLWYDVIVDDYLPVDLRHNVLFTRNLKCPNEFWICLIEKAFAKFAGGYDKIHGGYMEDAAQTLSGGIYNIYHSELVQNVTSNKQITGPQTNLFKKKIQDISKNDLKSVVPTVNELFLILKHAIRSSNLVGVFSLNPKFPESFGVFNLHQYNVSDVFIVQQKRFVKVHNPHNVADKIKKSQKHASLVAGVLKGRKTFPGEFL